VVRLYRSVATEYWNVVAQIPGTTDVRNAAGYAQDRLKELAP